jgi:hypothetical protein
MTTLREAAQQALETLEALSAAENIIWVQKRAEIEVEHLRAALAQPEQAEPVAWRYKGMMGMPWSLSDDGYYVSCKRDNGYMVEPLYTHPPRREWRSLTEEEIGDVFQAARNAKLGSANDNSRHRLSVVEIAHAIEVALKEKNNG